MSSSDTKMVPLQFQAGINRERTRYSSKGYWYDGNRVRFRDGQPENIRGWAKKVNSQFDGVARAITSWASLAGASYAAFGTDQLLYIYNGGAIFDVTPIATVVCVSSNTTHRFAVSSGSNRITVDTAGMSPSFNTLSITQNTHVIVSTADNTSIAGILLNGTQFRTSVILSTDGDPDSSTFRMIASATANATTSVITTITKLSWLLQAGQQEATEGLGYGTYLWNAARKAALAPNNGYGTPAPVGAGFTTNARNWSFTLWGEDLIANPYHGRIYQWVENNGTNTRAVAITSAPTENTVVIASPLDQLLQLNDLAKSHQIEKDNEKEKREIQKFITTAKDKWELVVSTGNSHLLHSKDINELNEQKEHLKEMYRNLIQDFLYSLEL